MASITALHERVERLMAQGLRHITAADLDALIQELSGFKLPQPAALLTSLQHHLIDHTITQVDRDTFIKVRHTLNQAGIQFSSVGTVEKRSLVPLSGMTSIYLEQSVLASVGTTQELVDIIDLPNSFLRAHCLREYLCQAAESELTRSIEIAWCDSALSQTIASALQTRPDEALALAKTALEHPNPVIQWTAIQVLKAVGALLSHQQVALAILQAELDYLGEGSRRYQEEARYYVLKEAVARVNNQDEAYRVEMQRLYDSRKHNVQRLRSAQKGEQQTGIYGIAQSKHPYFALILAEALEFDDAKLVKSALRGLFEILGFVALPAIIRLLDGPHAIAALETLTEFGDRSVLRYIFTHLETKAIPAHFRDALQKFDTLIIPPLCATLKRLDNPAAYKKALSSIFATLRSDDFVQMLISEAERDPVYADKLLALLHGFYPKYFKTPRKKKALPQDFSAVKPMLPMLLGGRTIRKPRTAMFRLTPDTRRLVVLSHGQTNRLTVFQTATWKEETVLPVTDYPSFFAVTPDGKYLLTSTYKSQEKGHILDVWEIGGRAAPIGSFHYAEPVNCISLSADGRRLFIGGETTIAVVEFGTWNTMATLSGHQQRISFMTVIPERHLLLTGDWQGWLQVWDDVGLQPVARLKSDSWDVRFASLSSDRQLLIYAGHVGVHIWETGGWREIFSQPKPNNIDGMALTPDDKYLVAGMQKKLRILELDTLKEVFSFESDTPIRHIEVTADGKHIITFGRNGLKIWHVHMELIEQG